MTPAIQTFDLTKRYPKSSGWGQILSWGDLELPAVDRVNLQVRKGELFGLLGPNGAGKTTLIKMLATLIKPTRGTASVNGFDLEKEAPIKASIGLVTSDERSFYWRLTGRQNLAFFASLHGLSAEHIRERIQGALDQVRMQDVANKRFQTYSTGMRQRLSIARGLLSQPKLLFLDEPTKGLDPGAIKAIHELILEELVDRQGLTIFLTTHSLDEAEALCSRIAIMNHGRIKACGTVDELRESLHPEGRYRIQITGITPEIRQRLTHRLGDVNFEFSKNRNERLNYIQPRRTTDKFIRQRGDMLCITGSDGDKSLNRVIDILRENQVRILNIEKEKTSLMDVFAKYIDNPEHSVSDEPLAEDHICSTNNSQTEISQRKPNAGITTYYPGFSPRIAAAFLKRDWFSEVSYRFSFFLQFLNIFFTAGVFYFISQLLGDAAAPYLQDYGGDYFSFVLIGIALGGYFGVGLSSFSNRLRQAQTTGTLEAMLTTPTSLSAIVISSSLWDYLLTTVRVGVYLAIGVGILGMQMLESNILAALIILSLTIIAFSSLGILAASFIMVLKRGDPITWAFSAVSSLLGGVYYPVELLPQPLQWLSKLLPITYSLEGLRLALLQGASISHLLPEITALAAFSLILLPLSLFSFRFAVGKAKRDGSLTHY